MEGLTKLLSIGLSVATLVSMIVGACFFVAPLRTDADNLKEKVVAIEQRNREQDERFARIDESRSLGLQRLSRVEEAVAATKDQLVQINAKLDRALTRR